MKQIIHINLISEIRQEGVITKIEEKIKGYLHKEIDKTIIFFKINQENYKYILSFLKIEIIKKGQYSLLLNKEKITINELTIENNQLKVECKTKKIIVKENSLYLEYGLLMNKTKLGDYKVSLFYE